MEDKTEKKRRNWIPNYFLLFLLVAGMGWLWETVYFLLRDGELLDRGFLNLPICPIYGIGLALVYLLLGTPKQGHCLLGWVKNRFLLVVLYFILAAAIPTVLELVTGWAFDYFLDLRLWNYAGNPYEFHGYICLEITLEWGIAITAAMALIFPLLERLFSKIPSKAAAIAMTVSLILIAADFGICLWDAVRQLI